MKKTILNKGYTLSVSSWENDGDNCQINTETYDTKEEDVEVTLLDLS